jgi:hypothetical protein
MTRCCHYNTTKTAVQDSWEDFGKIRGEKLTEKPTAAIIGEKEESASGPVPGEQEEIW